MPSYAVIDKRILIQAAQTSDLTAVGCLLVVCQVDVRRYARRHCLASDVDDTVQESVILIAR
jgi:hypothetical protein